MFTLIEKGEVYEPEYIGRTSLLIADDKNAKIGNIDSVALRGAGLEVEVIDAGGWVMTPGFIDPHQHVLGGS